MVVVSRPLGTALVEAAVVLVPSYAMAWATGEMVWTIPTMAGASFVATAIGPVGVDASSDRTDEGGPSATHDAAVDGGSYDAA